MIGALLAEACETGVCGFNWLAEFSVSGPHLAAAANAAGYMQGAGGRYSQPKLVEYMHEEKAAEETRD